MAQTARDKFRVGQAVRTTPAAVKATLAKGGETGVVVGFGRVSTLLVRVRKDGQKTAQSYHMRFWEAG